jgi:hypothetical protein
MNFNKIPYYKSSCIFLIKSSQKQDISRTILYSVKLKQFPQSVSSILAVSSKMLFKEVFVFAKSSQLA